MARNVRVFTSKDARTYSHRYQISKGQLRFTANDHLEQYAFCQECFMTDYILFFTLSPSTFRSLCDWCFGDLLADELVRVHSERSEDFKYCHPCVFFLQEEITTFSSLKSQSAIWLCSDYPIDRQILRFQIEHNLFII